MTRPPPAPADPHTIRQYYERNTRLFLSLGRQEGTHTIHRAVWGAYVRDREAALNYTNELIRQQLLEIIQSAPVKTLRTADLGCGVGGSLFYLAHHMPSPFWGVGLTISPQQARLAGQHASRLDLQEHCSFLEADFLHLPLADGLDAAFSIEAFAHTPDPEGYLREAARLLRSEGRLMLCDDFRTILGEDDNYWLHAFQRGWHVPGLSSAQHVKEIAQAQRLEPIRDLDLTPYLRLSVVPERLARAIAGTGTKLKHLYWQSLTGGMALQQCLKQELVSYRFLVFEKR